MAKTKQVASPKTKAKQRGRAAIGEAKTGKTKTSKTSSPPIPRALWFGAGLEPMVKGSSALTARVAAMVKEVQFTVATKTLSGKPIQQQMGLLTADNLKEFEPRPDAQQGAIEELKAAGCRLIRQGRFATTMSGPSDLVETLIGGKLVVQARARRSPLRSTQMFATDFEAPLSHDLFLAPESSLSVSSNVSEHIDDLVFIPPPLYFDGPPPTRRPAASTRWTKPPSAACSMCRQASTAPASGWR
jgi:hypothetical protein